MKTLLFLAVFGLFLVVGTLADIIPEHDQEWEEYKRAFNKEYQGDVEEQKRRENWEHSLSEIEEHNKHYERGEVDYEMGLNDFSDESEKEFASTHFETLTEDEITARRAAVVEHYKPSNKKAPASWDWREKNVVTPVKNQGHCSSCWAFSVIGSFEGQVARRIGRLVSYSEQNLLECIGEGCSTCGNGCYTGKGLEFIKNHDVNTDVAYPYTAKKDQKAHSCRQKPNNNSGMKLRGYTAIHSMNDSHLIDALVNIGPISIATECVHGIRSYKKGVYEHIGAWQEDPKKWNGHAMLLVGYGTSNNNHPYWIIKNSWDSWWGEKGYFLLSRRHNNHCGISSGAFYPVLK